MSFRMGLFSRMHILYNSCGCICVDSENLAILLGLIFAIARYVIFLLIVQNSGKKTNLLTESV